MTNGNGRGMNAKKPAKTEDNLFILKLYHKTQTALYDATVQSGL